MKRAALLVLSLTLFGCGGGGTTTSGSVSPEVTGSPSPAASFTVKLVDSSTSAKTQKMTVGNATSLPTANKIRVVARIIKTTYPIDTDYDSATDSQRPVIMYDGAQHYFDFLSGNLSVTSYPNCGGPSFEVLDSSCKSTGVAVTEATATHHPAPGSTYYKKIIDNPYAGGNVTVSLPENLGYTLDIITSAYDTSTQKNIMIKFGTISPVNVSSAGGSATVTMNGFENIVTYSPEALTNIKDDTTKITSDEIYNLTVKVKSPLRANISVGQSLTNTLLSSTSMLSGTSGSPISFRAPVSYVDPNLYFQGSFTIEDAMLKTGESASNWTRIYPNPAYGESVSTDLLMLFGYTAQMP